jgi:hypothetical protein
MEDGRLSPVLQEAGETPVLPRTYLPVRAVYCQQESFHTPIIPAHGWAFGPSIAMRPGRTAMASRRIRG